MKKIFVQSGYLFLLLIITFLSACASPPQAAGLSKPALGTPSAKDQPTQISISPVVPSPALSPAALQPTGTARSLTGQVEGCSEAQLSAGVLLVTWDARAQENRFSPIDPSTGQPLCNFEPIKTGRQFFTVRSPDEKMLAITISKREDGGGARLHLLDLNNWRLAETPIEFDRWVGLMAYSPNGQQLAVVSYSPAYSAQGMLHGSQLSLIDLENQTITAESLLDFNPRLMDYLPDGSAVVLYGGSQNSEYLAQGDPMAVMLDSSNLNEIWKTTLPGVLEGAYQDKANEGPEGWINWTPGVAFSPQSQELYIVHADSDRLTKIDFAKKTLGTIEIRRATSWLERLLAMTAGVAHAKTMNGTFKTAVLSPDGERLFVVGVTGESSQDSYGNWQFDERWQGLQVVDPTSGAELAHLEVDSSDLALSPDGKQIFLRGWNNTSAWTEVIDADSLKLISKLKGLYLVNASTLDGEPVLLSNVSNEHQTSLSMMDPTTNNEISRWRVWGYANWLTTP